MVEFTPTHTAFRREKFLRLNSENEFRNTGVQVTLSFKQKKIRQRAHVDGTKIKGKYFVLLLFIEYLNHITKQVPFWK